MKSLARRLRKMAEEATKMRVAEVKNLNAERNSELVKVLEEWTKLAKEGHLSDVALIGKLRGAAMTEFHWDTDNPLEIIGALELAKSEIASDVLAEADPDADDDEDDE